MVLYSVKSIMHIPLIIPIPTLEPVVLISQPLFEASLYFYSFSIHKRFWSCSILDNRSIASRQTRGAYIFVSFYNFKTLRASNAAKLKPTCYLLVGRILVTKLREINASFAYLWNFPGTAAMSCGAICHFPLPTYLFTAPKHPLCDNFYKSPSHRDRLLKVWRKLPVQFANLKMTLPYSS